MKWIIVTGIGLLAILSAVIIPLLDGETTGEVNMEREYKIPPIDANRSAVTETAAFALG
jgi:hypothetical protein